MHAVVNFRSRLDDSYMEGIRAEATMADDGAHILIVDDNDEVLATLSELLEAEGFRVTACGSGLAALLRIGLDRPSLVLLDLKLSDISGFDVHRVIRADADLSDLPILFISGVYLDQELLRTRLNDPHARLLLKPVPESELVAEIERARLRGARPEAA